MTNPTTFHDNIQPAEDFLFDEQTKQVGLVHATDGAIDGNTTIEIKDGTRITGPHSRFREATTSERNLYLGL